MRERDGGRHPAPDGGTAEVRLRCDRCPVNNDTVKIEGGATPPAVRPPKDRRDPPSLRGGGGRGIPEEGPGRRRVTGCADDAPATSGGRPHTSNTPTRTSAATVPVCASVSVCDLWRVVGTTYTRVCVCSQVGGAGVYVGVRV